MYSYHKWYTKNGSHKMTTGFYMYCTYKVRKTPFNEKKKMLLLDTVVSRQNGYYNILLERLKYIVTTNGTVVSRDILGWLQQATAVKGYYQWPAKNGSHKLTVHF